MLETAFSYITLIMLRSIPHIPNLFRVSIIKEYWKGISVLVLIYVIYFIYKCWIILKFLEWNQLTNLIMVFPLMCSWIQKIFYCYFLMSLFIEKLVVCVCRCWAPFNSGYHLIRVFSFCVGTFCLLVGAQYWNHPLLLC